MICLKSYSITWNCWNFSPSAVNCNLKFFSVANNCETCSAYSFIWDCSWINFSSCCLSFKSAIWSSSVFCFNCEVKTQSEFKFTKASGKGKKRKSHENSFIKYLQDWLTFWLYCCSESEYWSASSFNLCFSLEFKRIAHIKMKNVKLSHSDKKFIIGKFSLTTLLIISWYQGSRKC